MRDRIATAALVAVLALILGVWLYTDAKKRELAETCATDGGTVAVIDNHLVCQR